MRAPVARTWPYHHLDLLADIARLAQDELSSRDRRRLDQHAAQILECITDACVFLNREWRYTYVNQRAGEIFGRRSSELVGKHIWTEFPEGVGQAFDLAYRKAMAEQQFATIEAYYPPWNRWFENRIHPSPDGLAIFFQDVTERRASARERMRLATIVETTPDAVIVSDADGVLLYVNRAGRVLLDIADDAHLGSMRLVGLHALDARALISGTALPTARRTGMWRGDAALVSSHARTIATSELVLWHPEESPERGYYSLIARDISAQQLAELQQQRDAATRAQSERMAHFGRWVWDIDENHVTWSPELFQIYGLDPGSFSASFESYLARLHPQDRGRVQQTIEQSLRDRKPITFDERIVRPNGEVRYLHSWATVAIGNERGQNQMFGACLDMTELTLATQGLRRTQEWLEVALSSARVAVWDWDVHTRNAKWSAGAAQVFGLASGEFEVAFDAYLDHVHPDDRARVEEAIRVSVDSGADLDIRHRIVAGDGSVRWVMGHGRALRDASGQVVRLFGTVSDVTDRQHAEEERQRLLEKVRHGQQMEAIGRLAAGVAHDFNNHLTIIRSASEILRRSAGANTTGAIDSIDEAAQRAASLTRQLLAFGRGQALRMSPLDLNQVTTDAFRLLRHLLPPNIEIVLDLADALPHVYADRGQLEQVLLNLIVNARDAMPEGGQLTILTRAATQAALLLVRDTGVGMSPDLQSHIFEPFFTTKSDNGGTGLGLATVYGIITQLGGSIDVRSKLGDGTTFTLHVPLAKSPPPT
jgi:PAS domain S-box-containing protein